MKHFTLTLLALLQCFYFHEVLCHDANDDHQQHLRMSVGDILKVNSSSAAATTNISEKKSQRDQRTLHRRAGGHLVLGVTSTTTLNPLPTHLHEETATELSSHDTNSNFKNHKTYFRRKVKADSNRSHDENKSSSNIVNVAILDSKNSKELNDDENNLDFGLMTMSAAGEGTKSNDVSSKTSSSSKSATKKDEKQKTLSDQIAEGKYGLIEKELFSKTPKRPGIVSYKTNPETPNDNEKTLGGLDKDEIWLSEDHLLVLKGGVPNEKKNEADSDEWKPIDDYEAPARPVKIPINPRVPPPFPVQLTDNGPLQFIGHNQFSLFNPFTNETGLFTNDPSDGAANFHQANSPDPKNLFTGPGTFKNLTKDQIRDVIPPPPWLHHKTHNDNDLLKHFPFNLPLPENRTEDFDEDDPSLFYPPPYSFIYKINHTNLAPIGPLVPGIILPPPPNFFSVYDPDENKKPVKTPIDVINRIQEIHLKNRLSASSTTTTTSSPPKLTSYVPTLREFTRKAKVSSSTPSTRLHKTKQLTTLRPSTTTSLKIHPYDTTTLKLHPVYVPTSGSTTSSTTTTTIQPPAAINIKPYQQDYGTQAHPIYFEYFDARTANPIKSQYIGPEYQNSYETSPVYNPISNTSPTPQQVVRGGGNHNKKPKSFYQPQFLSSTISPHPQHIDTKFLFVTPKPELQYASVVASPQPYPVSTPTPLAYNTVPVQKPLVLKPVGRFEDEIAAIQQTLDFYNGKKFQQKTPKVKAVYEFSFEASKHKNQQQDDFQPMLSYDQKNYYSPKPEINYSQLSELIKTNSYYPTTTETTMKYYRTKQSATLPPKKNSATETSASTPMAFGQKLRPQNLNYYVRPMFKEVVTTPQKSQKIINYSASYDPINVDHGYRINNRNVKYRKPSHHQQQQQQHHEFYEPASEVASLLNDTIVNYKQPLRPINPLSEFINVDSRFPPQNSPPYISQPQPLPPQYQPHNPYYPVPYPRPIPIQQQQQPQYHHQQHHQQQHPINLVKYEYPQIPQINPESVHITFYNRPMEKSDNNYYVTPRI
ncbi:CLUMA_CG003479, isoform A [Clunio marinus]|uniref:CLUMA_CG003479, isoform A n=1 Tax=Clunio marinus TaxID=568069 RepID=A0A1J1HUH8_9DIPT|nr:CLUMA_CG003479, isoform A [Clunio marinus]